MYEMCFDIETNGLDIYQNSPIQLAYEIHANDLIVEENMFYIKQYKSLPEIIKKITGITDDTLLKEGIDAPLAVQLWQNAIKKHQPMTLIGYNCINFDFPMIMNWINVYSSLKYKYPPVCKIYDLMFILSAEDPTRKWMKLQEAAEHMKVDFNLENFHGADYDVKVTRMIYQKLKAEGRL